MVPRGNHKLCKLYPYLAASFKSPNISEDMQFAWAKEFVETLSADRYKPLRFDLNSMRAVFLCLRRLSDNDVPVNMWEYGVSPQTLSFVPQSILVSNKCKADKIHSDHEGRGSRATSTTITQ